MRDNQIDEDFKLRAGADVSLLYVDLQRVQDRNTLRDRQLTATSLGLSHTANNNGISANSNNGLARANSGFFERRQSVTSYAESVTGDRDEFEGGEEKVIKPTPVRYQRLDDRLSFANSLVAANPADIIVIDCWPEECLMRSSFPALDDRNEEDSYVTKTAYRPNGGRGTMIAVKKRCLVPEDEKHTNVGLIGLERLVKRSWTPSNIPQAGINQAWVHAADAGPACLDPNRPPLRLAVVAYDCGRGYRFQGSLNNETVNSSLSKTPAALFSSRLFLNCRSSSFTSDVSPTTSTIRSVVGQYETKTTLLKPVRSNSSVGSLIRNGSAREKEQGHTWWRGSTTMPNANNDVPIEEAANGSSTPKIRERKNSNSWIETRAATPMEEAEERIRIAGELKQLKSFISVTLANQIGDRRRHLDRRGSESSLDKFNQIQGTSGALALVVGRFGINSLPLAQSLASCANTHITNQECQVTVCDNDRCETMAAMWWKPKSRYIANGFLHNGNSQDPLQSNNSIDDILSDKMVMPGQGQISINDSTALLEYDRNEWLEAEFECRPRMFTVTFQ